MSPTHSLHITVGQGNRVSAHIDRYSPLANNHPEHVARYALHRIAAHNLVGIAGNLARLIPGPRRRRRSCARPAPRKGREVLRARRLSTRAVTAAERMTRALDTGQAISPETGGGALR